MNVIPTQARAFIEQVERSARQLMAAPRLVPDLRSAADLEGLEVSESTWAEWDEAWRCWSDPAEAARARHQALAA